jgi:hypothetical protein
MSATLNVFGNVREYDTDSDVYGNAFEWEAPSDVPVIVCVKRAQTYHPGADASQLYRAGATVNQTYRPGVDAMQEECC